MDSITSIKTKINGTWKEANFSRVKVGGVWKTVQSVWVKINGQWIKK